jgi:hypothetical protein
MGGYPVAYGRGKAQLGVLNHLQVKLVQVSMARRALYRPLDPRQVGIHASGALKYAFSNRPYQVA